MGLHGVYGKDAFAADVLMLFLLLEASDNIF